MSSSDLLTLFDNGSYKEFLERYPQDVTEETENDNLLTARGISYLRIGEAENAVKCFNVLLAKNSSNKEAIIYKTSAGNVWMQECIETGNELLGTGQMQQAAEVYSQINLNDFTGLNKNLIFQLCNNLAVCLLNLGRAAEALEAFASPHLIASLEDDSNSPISLKRRSDTALNKAIILKSLNRPEEALTEFDNCLSHQSENLTAICGKSEILSGIGRFEEAIQIASDAIDSNPLDENTTLEVSKVSQILSLWVARGFASIKLNSFSAAITDFNFVMNTVSRVPGISPNETSVKEASRLRNICLGYHADHLLGTGEIEKAIGIYDEAIEISGGVESAPVNVLFNRAYAHYQLATGSTEHLEKSIEGFQCVVKKDPNHFQGQTGLGQALLNKADAMATGTDDDVSFQQEPIFLAAIESLKQAHILDPSDTQILYNLALTLLRTNQPQPASSKFRLLLSMTPDSENAAKGLTLCEQMLIDNSRIEALKKKRAEAQAAPAPAIPTPSGDSKATATATSTPVKSPVASNVSTPNSTPVKETTESSLKPVPTSAFATMSVAPAPSNSASSASAEPKSESGIKELMKTIRDSGSFFPYSSLKSPGPYPDTVHASHRELYLSEEEFRTVLAATKEEFLAFPQWKQVSKKKAASLF